MTAPPRSYDCLTGLDPALAAGGYALAGTALPSATLARLRAEARRLSGRSGPLDPLAKDGCGLVSVVAGLDRHSEIAFDTARDGALATLVTALIGPGWVPFRSQLLLPSPAASLGQWHQDQPVFADHFDDEIALTVAVPVDVPGDALRFAARQPRPGRLLAHAERAGTILAFATADPAGPDTTPPWRAGVPLAFHSYSVHRWTPAVPCAVYLFGYRTSRLRRSS